MSDLISDQPLFTRHVDHRGALKAEEVSRRLVIHDNDRTFTLLIMKATSFLFALGLGALVLAHSGPETHSNVKDLSIESNWDSAIGKGIPALVELYVL